MQIQDAVDYGKFLLQRNRIPGDAPTTVDDFMDEVFRRIDKEYADLVIEGILTGTETFEKQRLIDTFNQWVRGEITVTL